MATLQIKRPAGAFALLSIICFGSVDQAHSAQAAIARTAYATSRSLVTNGFNTWMAHRNTINYIGLGLFCANTLGYAVSLHQTIKAKKQQNAEAAASVDAQHRNSQNDIASEKAMHFFKNCLYPIAFSWLALSLKPEAILGVITSNAIYEHWKVC